MNYTITRQEEYQDTVFIRIDTDKPVYKERFIPKTSNLRDEVEDMLAELKMEYDAYVAPFQPTVKTEADREALKASVRAAKVTEKFNKKKKDKEDKLKESKTDTLS